MPAYLNHLKIWFPKKGTHPLGGIVNELRLIEQSMSYRERGEKLILLTDFSSNADRDVHYVTSFCNKYDIALMTTDFIKGELVNGSWKDKKIQLKLFEMAMLELTHPAGHPVIASDIFRLLSPVLTLGAYSDLDKKINYGPEPASMSSLPALVLNLTLDTTVAPMEIEYLNTDFIYAKNTEHGFLLSHRKTIYTNYLNIDYIANIPLDYIVCIFGKTVTLDEAAINDYRQFTQNYFIAKPERTANNVLDFRQALKAAFPQHCEQYFYFYVVAISGPGALLDTLNSQVLRMVKEIAGFSVSKTPIRLINEASQGASDLSWMEVGCGVLREQGDKVTQATQTLQRFWRSHKKEPAAEATSSYAPCGMP
ncbi:hypothetical protein [Legionella rowbothamii]|uniref:hypothetical protein n=1 Tax=Legionella rowbothamii TaxID=96229 RepID=UPI0010546FBA|nr:hypothetical protein [Legionella rowbothamii]